MLPLGTLVYVSYTMSWDFFNPLSLFHCCEGQNSYWLKEQKDGTPRFNSAILS